MNGLTKFFILSVLFIGFSIGSYWLIFSQGLVFGITIGFTLLLFSAAVLGFSLYGIHFGQLEGLRLNSPLEVAGLLIVSVYFSAAIILLTFSNSLMELRDTTMDYSVSDKTTMLFSTFLNNDAAQISSGTTQKNGIIYSFTSSTEDEVEKIDRFLQDEKDRIIDFYGNDNAGNLTIVFHDDFDTLSEASGYEEAMGYYDFYSQEIHIVPDDYSWDIILLHEYAHHQSHLYAEANGLSPNRLPLWFEEGTADYLAGETSDWYELSEVEIIDFTQLDTDYPFHSSYSRNFDPYVQSFLAVESLVNEYGEELLPTFLEAKMLSEFYGMLEDATGMKLADFQETFLDDMIEESTAEQEQYDAAFSALDRGDLAKAQQMIDELMATATEEDLYQLAWMQTDVFLLQDQLDEAILFMEERLEKGDPDYLIDDLTTLAELYVLTDPAKSLELIEEADAVVQEDEEMDMAYYDLDGYLEAYELISSASPYEGYMILLEEELLYNETIIEKVEEKVATDFPEAS